MLINIFKQSVFCNIIKVHADILLSIQNFYDCVQVSKFRNRNIIICWRLVIVASSGLKKSI
jgi:hypothetical protein